MFRLSAVGLLALIGCGSPAPDRPSDNTVLSSSAAPLPVPRTEVAGAVLDGRVLVAGGLTADGAPTAFVHSYDPASDRWSPLASLPRRLHHFGLASFGGRVWLAGGYTNEPGGPWVPQAAVLSLGTGERTWRDEAPLAVPRGALALTELAGQLVAIGGATARGPVATVEILAVGPGGTTPDRAGWKAAPPLSQPREHLAAASSGGRVYAIAGRVGSLESNLSTVESWAPGERVWRSEPPLREARGGFSGAGLGGSICVAGGEEPARTIATVECLRSRGWEARAFLKRPRHGLAVVALDVRLHVVGGGPQPGLSVSDAHEVIEVLI